MLNKNVVNKTNKIIQTKWKNSTVKLLVSYSVHDNVWELWLFIREFRIAAMLNSSPKKWYYFYKNNKRRKNLFLHLWNIAHMPILAQISDIRSAGKNIIYIPVLAADTMSGTWARIGLCAIYRFLHLGDLLIFLLSGYINWLTLIYWHTDWLICTWFHTCQQALSAGVSKVFWPKATLMTS